MKVIAIVAASLNNVIGVNGRLPWKAPSDLARFQKETMGHNVLMGRKTWDSLPKSGVPGVKLPGRNCHVVTRNQSVLKKPAASYGCNGLWADFSVAAEKLTAEGKLLFIIGGSVIFEEAFELDLIDEVWLTRIGTTVYPQVGETLAFFPQHQIKNWPKWCERLTTEPAELGQVFERYENPKHSKKEEPEMAENFGAQDKEIIANQQNLLAAVVSCYMQDKPISFKLVRDCAAYCNENWDLVERPPQTDEAERPSPMAEEVAATVGERLKTALNVSGGVMKIENLTINIS